jgi:hypothetical protein
MRLSALRLATAAAVGLGGLALGSSPTKADDYYPQVQQYRDHVHMTRAAMRTRVPATASVPARATSVSYYPAPAATYYSTYPYPVQYVAPTYRPVYGPARPRVFRPFGWFRR